MFGSLIFRAQVDNARQQRVAFRVQYIHRLPKEFQRVYGIEFAHTRSLMENDLQPFRLLTIAEAAELLQVSTRTLKRLIHTKELPAKKVGHQWRINESQLTSWIQGLSDL